MAEKKNFLGWVGFTGDDNDSSTPSSSSVDRIRELEAQIADLKSRRDITGLTREEFEILATETAMSMIKSAQARESKAQAAAARLIAETTRATKEELASADLKARSILTSAESRGRKYIQAAEAEAEEKVAEAEAEAEDLLEKSKREVTALTYAAKREGERIISTATGEITNYRQWLNGAIGEAERLYRIQKQALDSAESSIQQSRNRLDGAFQKLEELQKSILENLNPNDTLINSGPLRVSSQRTQSALAAPKGSGKKTAKKSSSSSSKKKTAKK
jgi:tetrahydromethanopterin S-methyltransferase subunit B